MDVDEALAIADRSGGGLVVGSVARALAEAIGRVRALHRVNSNAPDYDPYCEACRYDDGWPCPTILALTEDR